MSLGIRASSGTVGTQMRPSLRRLSLMRVSLDCPSPSCGMQVGWICMKQGLAKYAPRLWQRQIAVAFEFTAFVERK